LTTLLTGGGTRGREALDDDVDLVRDRALVTRAQSGDRSAFDDLYMRYYRRLYRFCLRRLHDSHEAEDVAQEAFARAWRALPTFGGDRRFYPWLSVIASHLCTDVLRRRNRSTPVAEFHQGNVASTEDGGEERVLAAVDSDLVARAFTRLSDRHQRILNLREGSGWSYQRIADHEGVGITAVETLLWRARQALKREFASLAGAEGRMAAWLGGLVSMASLRRLVGLPRRALRRLALTGAKGAILSAGSAVAVGAVIVGATLGAPTSGLDTHAPVFPASPTAADQPAGGSGQQPGGTGGSGVPGQPGQSSSSVSGVSLPGAPSVPSTPNLGLTLNGTLNGLSSTASGLTNRLGTTLNGPALTNPISSILNSTGSGVSGTGTSLSTGTTSGPSTGLLP
jgi:RNA polymerase sigma-70 factor (ECF subfamily)